MLYGSRVRRLGFAEGVKGGVRREVVAQQICPGLGARERQREGERAKVKRGGQKRIEEKEKRERCRGMLVMQY